MKVLIVEDEVYSAEKLERELLSYDPDIQILDKLESVTATVKWLQKNEADLLFLDIHLSDGLSFQVFEKVKPQTPVIFVTAYDQYAIRAFQVNSLDYLLKPVHPNDLQRAMDKFKQWETLREGDTGIDFNALKEALKGPSSSFQKRFMVYSGEKIHTIPVNEVAYFFSENKYTFLVSKKGKQFILDNTLDSLTNRIDPELFFRINRQFLIGIDSIETMFSHTKGRVKLQLNPSSNRETIVSVERSPEFKKWLGK